MAAIPTPSSPSLPSLPFVPGSPFGPCAPVSPMNPLGPCGPTGPCGPVTIPRSVQMLLTNTHKCPLSTLNEGILYSTSAFVPSCPTTFPKSVATPSTM